MTDEEKKKAEEASLVDEIAAVARDVIRDEFKPLQVAVTTITEIAASASCTANLLEFQDTAIRMAMLFVRSPHREGAFRRLAVTAFPEHVKDAIRGSFKEGVTVEDAIGRLEASQDAFIRATGALFRRELYILRDATPTTSLAKNSLSK